MQETKNDLREIWEAEGFHSIYTFPLVTKGEPKGVMKVFYRSEVKARTPDWMSFIETLAGQAAIAIENIRLFEGLQRSNMELAIAYDATIEGWSRAMDLRDEETEGHTQRVVNTTLKLASDFDFPDEMLMNIRRGALLHDIGKLGVPDRILLKPGKLTDEEWNIMKKHPTFAFEMLAPIEYLNQAINIPYCHHEKWDGTGYPRGISGEQIPLEARIFAVVDVWDAITSDRPYRKAWPKEKAVDYIRSLAGSHFDAAIVEKFLELQKKERQQ
jgi:HD-GYP domain-containing protein (c-di-GMP phosphodiesterase class II)